MVTFIFGAAIFVGTLIYRVTRGRSTTIHKTFKFWAIPSTQPGPICPILPKSILLLWFRDNTQIVQQVDHLKIQLMDHCNAKVSLSFFKFLSCCLVSNVYIVRFSVGGRL